MLIRISLQFFLTLKQFSNLQWMLLARIDFLSIDFTKRIQGKFCQTMKLSLGSIKPYIQSYLTFYLTSHYQPGHKADIIICLY